MHLDPRGIASFLEGVTKPGLGVPGQHEESSTSRPARAARQEVHGIRGGGHRAARGIALSPWSPIRMGPREQSLVPAGPHAEHVSSLQTSADGGARGHSR